MEGESMTFWLAGPIEEGEALRRLHESGAAPARTTKRRGRYFHAGMALAFLLTAFIGFAPTYYLREASQLKPLSPLVHVHGMVFTSWLVLLLVQTLLVAKRQVKLHRRLGIGGAVLAGLMVPLGFVTSIEAARRGLGTPGLDAVELMIFPMGSIVLFAGFIGAAIALRRKPDLHRRLVMLSTVAIIPPAIARMPFVGLKPVVALLLSTLFVVACMIHDKMVRGRVHRVYVLGALIILLSGPMRFGISQTEAWRSFATSLIGADAVVEAKGSDPIAANEQDDWDALAQLPPEAVVWRAAGL